MKPDTDRAYVTALVDGIVRRWSCRLGRVVTHGGMLKVEMFRRGGRMLIPWSAVREIKRVEP